ncbi:MAG: membrane protein insertase YidC [Acidobacteria bacterium]|nr:membrane protein insertase YidC [Acidobacteriota bacterium]
MTDSRRALIATALSLGVLWAWTSWYAPRPPERPPPSSPQAPAMREPVADLEVAPAPPPDSSTPIFPSTQADTEQILILESRTARVKITNVGARILSWRLLDYLGPEGHPLELVVPGDEERGLPFELVVPGDEARTKRLNEALYVCTDPETISDGKRIRCSWSDGRGEKIDKTLTLPDEGYVARIEYRASDQRGPVPYLAWAPGLIRDEGSSGLGRMSQDVRVAVARSGSVERITAGDAGDWQDADRPADWGGIEGHYFAAVIAPYDRSGHFTFYGREREEGRAQEVGIAWKPDGDGTAYLFVGPKSYDLLGRIDQDYGLGLQSLIDYGYFEVIVLALFWALKKVYGWTNDSYGLAIIILTVIIKLVFYPITQRSMVSMRKVQKQMKRLQPKIQHIKDRFARKEKKIQNRTEMQQEIMALYRKENVNPMASMKGCMPLLLQMPILFGFYRLLSLAIELRLTPFLYLVDLSAPEQSVLFRTLPLMMGASMWFQQRLSGTVSPDPTQRWMMSAMPVVMTVMFWNFPSGLVLYWLVNNILSIGQQYLINRQADATDPSPARGRAAVKRV